LDGGVRELYIFNNRGLIPEEMLHLHSSARLNDSLY